jgi:hypothetical protein
VNSYGILWSGYRGIPIGTFSKELAGPFIRQPFLQSLLHGGDVRIKCETPLNAMSMISFLGLDDWPCVIYNAHDLHDDYAVGNVCEGLNTFFYAKGELISDHLSRYLQEKVRKLSEARIRILNNIPDPRSKVPGPLQQHCV